jgi:hypothetical protein
VIPILVLAPILDVAVSVSMVDEDVFQTLHRAFASTADDPILTYRYMSSQGQVQEQR